MENKDNAWWKITFKVKQFYELLLEQLYRPLQCSNDDNHLSSHLDVGVQISGIGLSLAEPTNRL